MLKTNNLHSFFGAITMTKKKLREFERRISKHLYNEAQIMVDFLETDALTEDEFRELRKFMKRHPVHEVLVYIKKKRAEAKNREIQQP